MATVERNSGDGAMGVVATLRISIVSLVVFVVVTVAAAALGGIFTSRGTESWYYQIEKPAFNPPSWVFGPVWTVLYAAMAIAAWLVWRQGSQRRDVQVSTALFGLQLALNTLWSYLFFARESPLAGMLEIFVLLGVIIAWFTSAVRIDSRTRWLIIPYIGWVSFATLLTVSIWWLNR